MQVHREHTAAASQNVALARGAAAVAVAIAGYYVIQFTTRQFALHTYLPLPAELLQPRGFVHAFEHHTWQMLLALGAIAVLSGGRVSGWGLNLRNLDVSLHILRRFCVLYGIYIVGAGLLLQLLWVDVRDPGHPMTATHVTGRLAFGFLFAGVSEEILFRGLIHTFLAVWIAGVVRVRGVTMPVAGIAAALIFTVAHVGFTFSPFTITHLVPMQLVQSLGLGVFYSWAYHRTGSLLAPALAHNFSNGSVWLVDYLLIGAGRAGLPLPLLAG